MLLLWITYVSSYCIISCSFFYIGCLPDEIFSTSYPCVEIFSSIPTNARSDAGMVMLTVAEFVMFDLDEGHQ